MGSWPCLQILSLKKEKETKFKAAPMSPLLGDLFLIPPPTPLPHTNQPTKSQYFLFQNSSNTASAPP